MFGILRDLMNSYSSIRVGVVGATGYSGMELVRILARHPTAHLGPDLAARGPKVFDLSGAFRLRDPGVRQRWYPHSPELALPVAYGLTERYRDQLESARLIACAGCYPTAAILSLQPLVAAGLLERGIIIDAKSGVSGAGKTPSERTHFSEIH